MPVILGLGRIVERSMSMIASSSCRKFEPSLPCWGQAHNHLVTVAMSIVVKSELSYWYVD